jgi:hypothetical protein
MASPATSTPTNGGGAQPTHYRFHLPLRTEAELRLFAEKAWGLKLPSKKICANHSTPWRAFADAYFARDPVAVWFGSRGFSGKTHTLGGLGLTEAATLKCNVSVLGGSGEQSQRVHESMEEFWGYPAAPHYLLLSDPGQKHTFLRNGARINALMASQRSVRGGHPPRLRMDEIDEMELTILDAALGQTMTQRGVSPQIVLSSTRQYPDGTMQTILDRAVENDWPIYEWCYRETLQPHGWLTQRDVVLKRKTVPAEMWDKEYELQEPDPGARAINPEAVERMFKRELGEWKGRIDERVVIESPRTGAKYATGADWAKERDFTVITTWRYDCRPARLVAFERTQRRPWPDMVGRFNKRLKEYPGDAAHDATGLGNVVADLLTHDAEHLTLSGRTRHDLLSEYVSAIENDELEAPMVDYMYQEHKRASVEAVFGSEEHLPDSICSGALGWKACGFGFSPSVW